MRSIKLCFLLISFLFHFKDIESIKCYQCSSAEDPDDIDNCGAYEDFRKEQHVAVDCASDESKSPGTFCMKFTQQSPRGFIWDGRWRQVIRQCVSVAESGVTGVCNWGVLENGVYWEKCYCSDDGCNSSTKNVLATSLILFIFGVYFVHFAFLPEI